MSLTVGQRDALRRLKAAGEAGLPAGTSSTPDEISSRTASSLISRGYVTRDRRGPRVRYLLTVRGRSEQDRLERLAAYPAGIPNLDRTSS
jgi:hypothetical protein